MFDRVTENPLFSDVDKVSRVIRPMVADVGVIAVGGGSVIDAAKMIALLATNPGPVANYAGVPNVRHGRGRAAGCHSHHRGHRQRSIAFRGDSSRRSVSDRRHELATISCRDLRCSTPNSP